MDFCIKIKSSGHNETAGWYCSTNVYTWILHGHQTTGSNTGSDTSWGAYMETDVPVKKTKQEVATFKVRSPYTEYVQVYMKHSSLKAVVFYFSYVCVFEAIVMQ